MDISTEQCYVLRINYPPWKTKCADNRRVFVGLFVFFYCYGCCAFWPNWQQSCVKKRYTKTSKTQNIVQDRMNCVYGARFSKRHDVEHLNVIPVEYAVWSNGTFHSSLNFCPVNPHDGLQILLLGPRIDMLEPLSLLLNIARYDANGVCHCSFSYVRLQVFVHVQYNWATDSLVDLIYSAHSQFLLHRIIPKAY